MVLISTRRLCVAGTLVARLVHGQSLSAQLLQQIRRNMNQNSNTSWEMGTRAQTLTEIDFNSVSVFSSNYLSPTPPSAAALEPVLSIARNAIVTRSNKQLVADGSAADPASLGVAVLLGNWTNAPGANWKQAANDQLGLLLYDTPRSNEGAISHRTEYAQLWSDYVYMVPPFLAYYGAVTSNASLISESFNQIKLYREALRSGDGDTEGLWKHVVMGSGSQGGWNDDGIWSTGAGWAAAGMLRVLGTIKYSPFASQFSDETNQLTDWVIEIHDAMFKHLPSTGIFYNYANNASSFPDGASTAIVASTVYRLVVLTGEGAGNVPSAERARNALYANNGQDHFDQNGWLTPVVDPMTFTQEGKESPEGQAFILQLDNAWNEWKQAGSKSGAIRFALSPSMVISGVLLTIAMWIL